MPGTFGDMPRATRGRDFAVLADPGTARYKLGGATIDWSTVPTIDRNEVQTVSLTGSPTGGTYTLTYSGQTTGNIAFNATAAAVRTALEALSNVGVGNVVVTGSGPWVITFCNALANTDVANMTGSGANLTGGTSPAVSVAETTKGRAEADLTIAGGTVVRAGDKFLQAGTVLVEITSSGLYGPYDANASDGRQTITGKRGKVWILNRHVLLSEDGSQVIGDLLDAGTLFKGRVLVGGTGQPTESDLLSACPGVTWHS